LADPEEILLDADERMDGAVATLKRELNGVRSGRAHPSLIENLPVDYYGAVTPLRQLGTINAPEPRMLTIQVWDRGAVKAVEKAIQQSDLGLNPAVDGQLLRLPFPPLTEQRRKELVKLVHHKTEDSRVAVRNVRRHAHDELRKLEKEGLCSQDDLKRHEEELQRMTDRHIATIDSEGKRKEAELLEI
jgi:ribosome recycling factor